jgi:dethiobiotin synthetase
MKKYFVTGIGTGVGKTVVSAILTEKLHADYWKPIQSGDLHDTDTEKVKSLVTNSVSVFHPEAFRLSQPLSPHHAAEIDGVSICKEDFKLPFCTNNHLIIEGAGGIMVPLSKTLMMMDLMQHFGAEIIMVADFYLGSINHTLLTLKTLKQSGLPIKGLVFNGEVNPKSAEVILEYSGVSCLGQIPHTRELNKEFIKNCTLLIDL